MLIMKGRKFFEDIQALYEKIRGHDISFPLGRRQREKSMNRIKMKKEQEKKARSSHNNANKKKNPLKKEIMCKCEFKIRVQKKKSTMALELIRFIKKVLADLESEEQD
ncbi:hypothetical protein Tco_0545134 [Tanacetum coccineum]